MANLSASLAILGGILTVFSPCVLPILPIIVGRSLQAHRYGPIALVSGLIAGFAVIGSFLGVTSSWFVGLTNILRPIAIAFLLAAGIAMLFPSLSYPWQNLHFDKWLPAWARRGLIGEFLLGTQLGLLWTPCAGSVLGSILVLAALKHDTAAAFVLLLLYGLGAGIPLLAIAYGGRYLSQYLLRLRPYSRLLQRVGGTIVILSAIAIILGWDVQIQLWLAPIFPTISL